jgi:hypothetical protein
MTELERVRIARRMYATHPNREALAELLGLTRAERAAMPRPVDRDEQHADRDERRAA